MTNSGYRHFFQMRRRPHVQLGVAPGTIAVDPNSEKPQFHITAYNSDGVEEYRVRDLETLNEIMAQWSTVWIHVQGLGDVTLIKELGAMFGLHKLALEDVVNRNQYPKLESYRDHLYIVARAIPPTDGLDFHQVNVFVGEHMVITMQERPNNWDEPVRKRLREGLTRIRMLGANYLAYALLDSIVDCYIPAIERFSERLIDTEEQILVNPSQTELANVHRLRNEVLAYRRVLAPLKESVRNLSKEVLPPISEETRMYFRDCLDHVTQLLDAIETHREMARGLIDLCLSGLSNQMNEVMKVLTIIATIFIPLGFIAGLYGMNFSSEVSPYNMPELNWRWGYPLALALMAVVAIGLIGFFRYKGWLGSRRRKS